MKLIEFALHNWLLLVIALGSGGMLLWPALRGGARGGTLSAQGAVQLINRERAVVVDVREPDEFTGGHVAGSKNLPLSQFEEKLTATVKNKTVPLVLVCATGARASRAVATAKKLGYDRAQAVAGGLKSWKEANLPLDKA